MDASDEDDEDHRQLPRVCNLRAGREALGLLTEPTPLPRLTIDATRLAQINAYGGASIRAAIEVHLARDAANNVCIIPPTDEACRGRLHNLLSPLPSRCAYDGLAELPARDHDVAVPAMLVDDLELLEEAVRRAVPALGHPMAAQRALLEAAQVLGVNARVHGAGAPIPAVAAVMFEPVCNELQLVVVDLGPAVPQRAQGEESLRAAVAKGRELDYGSLDQLTRPHHDAGAQVEPRLKLAHGDGRAAHDGSWRYNTGSYVPGFIAGLEVRI